MNTEKHYDVIIIGGSYAGLSAAMALGRARRDVLIIDGGKPCNRQTPHAHNLITHDGERPADIAAKAKEQVLEYPTVRFVQGYATEASGGKGEFRVLTQAGTAYTAARLLLATGVRDIPMPIDGFAECWGISVLHCPYCHGYEVGDATLGIIANGDMAFEYCRLLRQWSRDLTLFTNGLSTLTAEQSIQIGQRGIRIVEKEIKAIVHTDGHLQHLAFADGSTHALEAVFARARMEQHSDIAKQLGCALKTDSPTPWLLQVDAMGQTSVPGVYAAGDNCIMMRSLANAMSGGMMAGAMINHDLVVEQF